MTDLSPATQAVLTAFGKYPLHIDHITDGLLYGALPAALRAAADLIYPDWDARCCHEVLNAIAAELETAQ